MLEQAKLLDSVRNLQATIIRAQADPTSDSAKHFIANYPKVFQEVFEEKGIARAICDQISKRGPNAQALQQLLVSLVNLFAPYSQNSCFNLINDLYVRHEITLPKDWTTPTMFRATEAKARTTSAVKIQTSVRQKSDGSLSTQLGDLYLYGIMHMLKSVRGSSQRRYKEVQDFTNDYFFQELISNPILILFRKVTKYFCLNHGVFKRLLHAFAQYFLNTDLYDKFNLPFTLPKPQVISAALVLLVSTKFKPSLGKDLDELTKFQDRFPGLVKRCVEFWQKDQNNTQTVLGYVGRLWLLVQGISSEAESWVLRYVQSYDELFLKQPNLNSKSFFKQSFRAKPKFLKNYSPQCLQNLERFSPDFHSHFLQKLSSSKDIICAIDILYLQHSESILCDYSIEGMVAKRLLKRLHTTYEFFTGFKDSTNKKTVQTQFWAMIQELSRKWKVDNSYLTSKPTDKRLSFSGVRSSPDLSSWKWPPRPNQFVPAYWIFYYLSRWVDRVRGLQQQEYPQTRLRWLSRSVVLLLWLFAIAVWRWM